MLLVRELVFGPFVIVLQVGTRRKLLTAELGKILRLVSKMYIRRL